MLVLTILQVWILNQSNGLNYLTSLRRRIYSHSLIWLIKALHLVNISLFLMRVFTQIWLITNLIFYQLSLFVGDVLKDSLAVRLFIKEGHHIALAQSFAKNMGLYGKHQFLHYFRHLCMYLK